MYIISAVVWFWALSSNSLGNWRRNIRSSHCYCNNHGYQSLNVPLLHFASRGDFKNVRDRFQKGANVNVQDSHGATPLICAAGRGDLNLLRELLKHNQVNVNARKAIRSFLYCPCHGGMQTWKYSSRSGARYSSIPTLMWMPNNNTAQRPLTFQSMEEISMWLWHSWNTPLVDVNVKDRDGHTPLMAASCNGSELDKLRELLKHHQLNGMLLWICSRGQGTVDAHSSKRECHRSQG